MYYAKIEKGKMPYIGQATVLHEGEHEITREQFEKYKEDILLTEKWSKDVYEGKAKAEAIPPGIAELVALRVEQWKAEKENEKKVDAEGIYLTVPEMQAAIREGVNAV